MKRWIAWLVVLCIAIPTAAWAEKIGPLRTQAPSSVVMDASEPGETMSAQFDEGVRALTGAPFGNRVEYAHIAGWTISRGYLEDHYCFIGQADGRAERIVLTADDPMSFVPAGDAIIYYGEDAEGEHNWVLHRPGDAKPKGLPLSISDEVFYADDQYIWYYTGVGEQTSIRRLARKGNEKKGFGRIEGRVVAMLEDGSVLYVDFVKNRVQSWKDNKQTTLYQPEEAIVSVTSAGRGVWVEHADRFGLVEDGKLTFTLPGYIAGTAGTTDQIVLLVSPDEGAPTYDVLMLNEVYRAYAHVGSVPASDSTNIELQGDRMTVWGPAESPIFEIPPVEEWVPYGEAMAQPGVNPTPVLKPISPIDPEPTAKPAQQSIATSAPVVTRKPIVKPTSQTSRLLNYEDWIRPYVDIMPTEQSVLNTMLATEFLFDGEIAAEIIEYPSQWPRNLFDGYIPEYTGEGWLYDLYLQHYPNSTALEDVNHAAVTVHAYSPEDVDSYIAGLGEYGLVEQTDPGVTEKIVANFPWAESFRYFLNDKCALVIAFGHNAEAGGLQIGEGPVSVVQFAVHYARKTPNAPEPRAARDTKLLNYFEWSDENGIERDERVTLDRVSDQPADEYGRLYRTLFAPSEWPYDALDKLIPAYTYPGVMHYAEITMPAKDEASAQMLITSMYILYYEPEDIDRYADELTAYGYREVPPKEFDAQEKSLEKEFEVYRVFEFPGFNCIVRTFNDEGRDTLILTVRCDGRYKRFFEQ